MARKQEDYDELSDPDNPQAVKYEDVLDAAYRIQKCLSKHDLHVYPSHYQKEFGIKLYYKPELRNRTGSYKDRGSMNLMQLLPADKRKIGLVLGSVGNFASSMSYHANKMNVPLTVVMPKHTMQSKINYSHNLGTKVILQGKNYYEADKAARLIAKERGLTYVNGRDHPQLLAGYGSLAVEVLEQLPLVDAVIVPVGCGGLICSIAVIIKHLKPDCLVYGVQPEVAPAFFKSMEENQPTIVNPTDSSLADSICISSVGVNALFTARPLLDKMLLVKEEWIAKAIVHLLEVEKLVVEGAGACTLAAIIGHLVPELKNKHVLCVLSGGNLDPMSMFRCIDKGLASYGRRIKFSIDIKNTPEGFSQLFKLLAHGGYDLVTHTMEKDRVYASEDISDVKFNVVCDAASLEHSLELKRLLDRAYPDSVRFDTEPFNDRTTCPCFVRKRSAVEY